tara:strand:+ start:567 stop:692 length:126 start_codon:yes stop_codon:yes gene_type:complete
MIKARLRKNDYPEFSWRLPDARAKPTLRDDKPTPATVRDDE